MLLTINGEKREIQCETVSELLAHMQLHKDMVAVELNKNIVHRQDFAIRKLKSEDKLEIVTVVGGG